MCQAANSACFLAVAAAAFAESAGSSTAERGLLLLVFRELRAPRTHTIRRVWPQLYGRRLLDSPILPQLLEPLQARRDDLRMPGPHVPELR